MNKMERTRKIISLITSFTFLVSFGLIILVGFWVIYPYKPIEFTSKMTITPDRVKAGQNATMNFSYCKYTDLPATIQTAFEDSIVYSTNNITTNNPKGCHTVNVLIKIPEGLPSEEYIVRKVFNYQVNPLRKVKVELKSEPFIIYK